MTQSNTSFPRESKYLLSHTEVMAIAASQNEEISGGGRKEIGSAIRRRRANRGSIDIKK